MKCREAENEILSRFDAAEVSLELKTHLAGCRRCSTLLAESAEVDTLFQRAAVLEPAPFLWTRIQNRLSERRARNGWFSGLVPSAYAWATVVLLVLLSFFLTSVENSNSINLDQILAQSGLTAQSANSNPFLMAQTEAVSGSNPFLEAMMPRATNPFEPRRSR
ncbi:MAG TPA: hypothetical protein VGL91_10685 [Acidobacteriota bacterium]|jgi:hypothetical protein